MNIWDNTRVTWSGYARDGGGTVEELYDTTPGSNLVFNSRVTGYSHF